MSASRVLVIHPPVSVARDFIDYPYFSNLGAAQLAAVLRATGHEVTLLDGFAQADSTLRWRDDGRAHLGAPVSILLEQAKAAEVIVLAYSPFHRPPNRCDVLGELLTGLRKQLGEATLLLADCYQSGQHYVEASGEDVMSAYPEIDAWVKYEAEVTVPALLARGDISGVHHGRSAASLDDLPFPAWDLVDLDAMFTFHARVIANLGRGSWAFPISGRTLPMVTSRGCPFSCVHCSSNPGRDQDAPKTQQRYSAERLGEYVTHLMNFSPTRLEVLDELINVNEAHFDRFLQLTQEHDIAFDIPNGMRADYLLPEHFEKMYGRVTTVSVSAESGSKRVVADVVKKQLDLAAIVAAAENAHAANVPLMIHYMIGLPGESAQEVNETLAFATDLFDRFDAFPAVQFATPLPGTQMADGKGLPIAFDWGPHFQTAPSQPDSLVLPETLAKFKSTFDQRLHACLGPQKLIINVTHVCNNHCTFCAVGTRTQIHGHPTRLREHLDKYRKLGVTRVDFDGGEPTLNPELLPLVSYARQIGYEKAGVTTNGRLAYYESYGKKLVRSGLTTLLFSVHGHNAQLHAQQVGVAEAFEQTVGGIENCLKHAPAFVDLGMNVTVTESNHQYLDAMAQLCWDMGLRRLNIQFLTPFGRATKTVAPDIQVAAEIAMRVIDKWKDRITVQIFNLPYCFMPGYESFMMGDLLQLSGHRFFVNIKDVNLGAYLAERRVRKPVCTSCPHAVFCGGFYELDELPEPPWLVSTDDLLRGVAPARVTDS